jgi:hypothetical protein
MEMFNDFSVQAWFTEANYELKHFFQDWTLRKWATLFAASVAFGFFCLRSVRVRD